MTETRTLPPPDQLLRQIRALHEELSALRRLLRASQAAVRAEEACRRRTAMSEEVNHAE